MNSRISKLMIGKVDEVAVNEAKSDILTSNNVANQ